MGTLLLETVQIGAGVFIDGAPVGLTPLPGPWTLKAGAHKVVLRPVRGASETHDVRVEAGKQVVLTALQVVAPPEPEVVEEVEVRHTGPGFSLAMAGYVTAGTGVLSLGLGVVFGVLADSKAEEAQGLDPANPRNTRAAQRALIEEAESRAFTANLLYGVGGVLSLSGAAMILLASDGPLVHKLKTVEVVPLPAGAGLRGWF